MLCAIALGSLAAGPAATRPTSTRPITRLSFRLAGVADLRVILISRADPASHYPLCTVQVYNNSDDEVILGYEPGAVVVHCGEYERRGPAPTFVSRREILRPNQPIEFELPPGGWARSPAAQPPELLIPTSLPHGRYPLWASFRIAPPADGLVSSEHDTFVVERSNSEK